MTETIEDLPGAIPLAPGTEFITLAPLGVPIVMSRSIGKLAEALCKAQLIMDHASKDSTNPFFNNSKYANITACLDAARAPLANNGVAVVQFPYAEGPKVSVFTMLAHTGGELIGCVLSATADKNTPQGIGSAITYLRRYSYSPAVGLGAEDDDGNAASPPPPEPAPKTGRRADPDRERPLSRPVTPSELKRLVAIASVAKWTSKDLKDYCEINFKVSDSKNLTWTQFSKVCAVIEAQAAERGTPIHHAQEGPP